jgi:hypothetical protein
MRTNNLARLVLLVVSILPHVLLGSAVFGQSNENPTDIQKLRRAFVCREVVDLKWEPLPIPDGCTWTGYELSREPPPPGTQNPIWEGFDHDQSFYRDTDVVLDETYTYSLRDSYVCPPQVVTASAPRVRSTPHGVPITVGDECLGALYDDWEFDSGVHDISSISVYEDAVLRISGGVVRGANGRYTITAMSDDSKIEIDGGELVDVTVSYPFGSGWVRNARIQGGGIMLHEDTGAEQALEITGNTFAGPFSPQLQPNKIWLQKRSRILLQDNQGAFGVYIDDESQATILNNRFEGYVRVAEAGTVSIDTNDITGGISLSGYGAPDGKMATATIIDSTITVTEGTTYAYNQCLRMDSNANVTVIRSRLENDHSSYAVLASSSLSPSRLDLQDSRIIGNIVARDDTHISLINNPIVDGSIVLVDQAYGRVAANKIRGNIALDEDVQLSVTGNVLTEGGLRFEEYAGGEFSQNTILPADNLVYALSFSHYPNPDPKKLQIEDNCIERAYGLLVSDMTGQVEVKNNWWGHTSGPFHFPGNKEGKGAQISIVRSSDDTVNYRPYLQIRPAYCRTTPKRAPVSVSTIIGPDGGRIVAGWADIQISSGMTDQEMTVTFSEQDASASVEAAGVPLPSTGDQVGIYFFDLSAVATNTSTPLTQFNQTYQLTIMYDETALRGVSEPTLALYWWNGNRWVRESSSLVNTTTHRLAATPDHMTLFALLGETKRVYLPVILGGS